MAEVSYLQLHEHDNDLDFFWHTNDDNSILFDRQNQVNFVIDMFHQTVEQSQSQPQSNGTDDDNYSSGFMFSDFWDDFFVFRTTLGTGSDSDFQPESSDPIPNANEWEELDDHALNKASELDSNGLEWEVLSNNTESNSPDLVDYNYTDYEMLFGQFLDTDSGRPAASTTVVENLSSVVIKSENSMLCAVCKDEIAVGFMANKLPCDHVYHGECIIPWLGIRNTCPVCRYELLTDDVEYERRKAERAGTD